MRAAYADPPYLGLAEKFYGDPTYDTIEAHGKLIERLCNDYDAWALSLNEPNLRVILNMCPENVRVAAWVKPFVSFKLNVTRAWAWEPVIFRFSNSRTKEQGTWRDFLSEPITLQRGFRGAKPHRFCCWIFEGLNLMPDDTFDDLFPGSGAVTLAYKKWLARQIRPQQLSMEIL